MRRVREKRTKLQKRTRVVALVLAAVSVLLGVRIYALGRDDLLVPAGLHHIRLLPIDASTVLNPPGSLSTLML